ncbi:hypothetical protein GL50803_0011566 [Giardia duodenalis]|uniref:Uncharacterized protein n=1 Tax=Giardia intestinalis (strain ATCC 50803 / WB clone C6) TaxID=184922 RepID=A8B2C4_GIAIC|nr:hypothetical protein GL50803_0011566 [Giardia intestinalis]KAE8302954.1 hypothetical protein GL50803_0011566 [Giardia intestinalis]|eukprot:XP_001709941.1 Hypothetical protein GL50803_11566 [Giardia lamblia ATCC 50803]
MSFTHVDPPAGTRGYEIERAAINIVALKTDRRGALFLTDESLIYHGNNFSFHVPLRDITLHEASAGIFESPFIKLTFQIPSKDMAGTIKFNFKSRSFDTFVSVFPVMYAKARQEALQAPKPPAAPNYAMGNADTIREREAPNALPPPPSNPPSNVPPYPGLPANIDTMETLRSLTKVRPYSHLQQQQQQQQQQVQQQPYVTTVTALEAPVAIIEQENRPLLEEDSQAFRTVYESTWGVVYNKDFDPKNASKEDQLGITQCLRPAMD